MTAKKKVESPLQQGSLFHDLFEELIGKDLNVKIINLGDQPEIKELRRLITDLHRRISNLEHGSVAGINAYSRIASLEREVAILSSTVKKMAHKEATIQAPPLYTDNNPPRQGETWSSFENTHLADRFDSFCKALGYRFGRSPKAVACKVRSMMRAGQIETF